MSHTFQPRTYASGDFITVEDKNLEAQNDLYLYENSVRGMWFSDSNRITKGIKMLAGRSGMPRSAVAGASKNILFGNFFTPGCIPVVTVTSNSNPSFSYASVRGIGQAHPSHYGFSVHVVIDTTRGSRAQETLRNFHVINWIAVGY